MKVTPVQVVLSCEDLDAACLEWLAMQTAHLRDKAAREVVAFWLMLDNVRTSVIFSGFMEGSNWVIVKAGSVPGETVYIALELTFDGPDEQTVPSITLKPGKRCFDSCIVLAQATQQLAYYLKEEGRF